MSTHVTELLYRINGRLPFEGCPPVEVTSPAGRYCLAGSWMRVTPTQRAGSVDEARTAVEPFLRAWEFQEAVRWGFEDISFAFDSADGHAVAAPAQDEDAAPNNPRPAEGELVIVQSRFPDPPSIAVSVEMAQMWERLKWARLEIREPFQSAAYFALTVAESAAGGRRQAAAAYNVDVEVLRRIGELASTRGTPTSARKALPIGAPVLTRAEHDWLDRALRLLILQMGSIAAGVQPMHLTSKHVGV